MNVTDLKPGDIVTLDYGAHHGTEDAEVLRLEDTSWGPRAHILKGNSRRDVVTGWSTEKGIGWRLKTEVEPCHIRIVNRVSSTGRKTRRAYYRTRMVNGAWFKTWFSLTVAEAERALKSGRYNIHGTIHLVVPED